MAPALLSQVHIKKLIGSIWKSFLMEFGFSDGKNSVFTSSKEVQIVINFVGIKMSFKHQLCVYNG